MVADQLHDAVGSVLAPDLGPNQGATTAIQFGAILGPPGSTGADSYGTAFRMARAHALGLDQEAVAAGLASLTQDEYSLVLADLADQPVTVGVVITETS